MTRATSRRLRELEDKRAAELDAAHKARFAEAIAERKRLVNSLFPWATTSELEHLNATLDATSGSTSRDVWNQNEHLIGDLLNLCRERRDRGDPPFQTIKGVL